MADQSRTYAPCGGLITAVLAAVFVAGCGPARPFTDGFYSPRNQTRLTEPLPPIAVYLLSDERGTAEPTLILESTSISGRRAEDHATEPVSTGVARALIEGFRARGFAVLDQTARRYSWDDDRTMTGVAVAGRVLEFGARITRSGAFAYDQRVTCRLVLDIYESESGRKLLTKTYSDVTEGWMLSAQPLTVLSRALERVVDQAVTDPELLGILRSRGGLSGAILDTPAMQSPPNSSCTATLARELAIAREAGR